LRWSANALQTFQNMSLRIMNVTRELSHCRRCDDSCHTPRMHMHTLTYTRTHKHTHTHTHTHTHNTHNTHNTQVCAADRRGVERSGGLPHARHDVEPNLDRFVHVGRRRCLGVRDIPLHPLTSCKQSCTAMHASHSTQLCLCMHHVMLESACNSITFHCVAVVHMSYNYC
jgi:hypothetical protein